MSQVEFSILGPLLVRLTPDAAPIQLGDKMRMLLGRLLLEPGVTLSAGALANDVWGDESDLADPRNSVQAAMKQVRRRIGDTDRTRTVIVSVDTGYRLVLSDPFQLDAERFKLLARRGRALAAKHPRAARAMLAEALECWRGRPLGEYADHRWAAGHAVELETLRAGAEADLNDVRLELGEYLDVEGTLRHQIVRYPEDERRRAQLVRALDGAGRAAEASLAYRDAARELGGAGPELRRLGERIGRGLRAVPSAPRPAATELRREGALVCAVFEPGGSREHAPGAGLVSLLIDRHDGVPYPLTERNAVIGAFADADAALDVAETLARRGRLRAAVALHAGPVVTLGDRLFGLGASRVRLLARAAHPGQVLVSDGARARLGAAVELRSLGEQRLEDLLPGEPLFELAEQHGEPFPAPDTLNTRPNNLPVQQTRFVGRAQELADLAQAIGAGELVTLLGVGGCGKTRLAMQLAARRLSAFHDGAWFSDLAELDGTVDLEALAVAVGQQLAVRPLQDEKASEALVRHLSDRSALLILDNCEHVLGTVVELVARLRRCPRLCIVATSRQPLRLDGERVIEVPAMGTALSAESDILPDAVELLLDRAGSLPAGESSPTLRDAIRICAAVEGSPLAIELAAAHVSTRGLAGVAVEVESMVAGRRPLNLFGSDDPKRPPRQRTIEAAIRWSHALLSPDERTVLHRLAVFRGTFGLTEAEVVAADDELDPARVSALVHRLVERSMVAPEPPLHGEARLRLSQPIRAFAVRQLTADELERARQRHVDVFSALAIGLAPQLFGEQEQTTLERLDADHDNLRAALGLLVERRRVDEALALVGALWWMWFSRGHYEEGCAWVHDVLALDDRPSRRRVRALRAGSHLAWWRGDYALTEEYNHALEACAREIEDSWGLAWAQMGFGAVQLFGNPLGALVLCEDSRRRFEALGRDWEAAYARQMVAATHWFAGDEGAAGEAYASVVEVFERLRHGSVLASARRGAGLMAARCGRPGRGEALCRDALRFSDAIGDRAGSAQALNFLGSISRDENDLLTAVERYADALAHARELGELWATCSALDGIAGVACALGEPELAVRLIARSARLADQAGYRQSAYDQRLRAKDVKRLRAMLGDRDFDLALSEGQLMDVGEAVASALAFAARVT